MGESNTTASASFAFASGASAVASGLYSRAHGANSTASGSYSFASGSAVDASGFFSFSHGLGSSAKSSGEVVFGRYNSKSTQTSPISLNGHDGLFRLGNGISDTTRSDAMTVLTSGQTSLINKEWKAAVDAAPGNATVALSDPPSLSNDSGGNALVVEGHAVLRGKVIIEQPQGDISMGIYQ
jgi:hypothetical protein